MFGSVHSPSIDPRAVYPIPCKEPCRGLVMSASEHAAPPSMLRALVAKGRRDQSLFCVIRSACKGLHVSCPSMVPSRILEVQCQLHRPAAAAAQWEALWERACPLLMRGSHTHKNETKADVHRRSVGNAAGDDGTQAVKRGREEDLAQCAPQDCKRPRKAVAVAAVDTPTPAAKPSQTKAKAKAKGSTAAPKSKAKAKEEKKAKSSTVVPKEERRPLPRAALGLQRETFSDTSELSWTDGSASGLS